MSDKILDKPKNNIQRPRTAAVHNETIRMPSSNRPVSAPPIAHNPKYGHIKSRISSYIESGKPIIFAKRVPSRPIEYIYDQSKPDLFLRTFIEDMHEKSTPVETTIESKSSDSDCESEFEAIRNPIVCLNAQSEGKQIWMHQFAKRAQSANPVTAKRTGPVRPHSGFIDSKRHKEESRPKKPGTDYVSRYAYRKDPLERPNTPSEAPPPKQRKRPPGSGYISRYSHRPNADRELDDATSHTGTLYSITPWQHELEPQPDKPRARCKSAKSSKPEKQPIIRRTKAPKTNVIQQDKNKRCIKVQAFPMSTIIHETKTELIDQYSAFTRRATNPNTKVGVCSLSLNHGLSNLCLQRDKHKSKPTRQVRFIHDLTIFDSQDFDHSFWTSQTVPDFSRQNINS